MVTIGEGEQRKRVKYGFRTSCLDQYDLGLKLNLFYFVQSLRLDFKQKRDKGDCRFECSAADRKPFASFAQRTKESCYKHFIKF